MNRYMVWVAVAIFVAAAVVGYEILASGSPRPTYPISRTSTITKTVTSTSVSTITKIVTKTRVLTRTFTSTVLVHHKESSPTTSSATLLTSSTVSKSRNATRAIIELASKGSQFANVESLEKFASVASNLESFLTSGAYGVAYIFTGSRLYVTVPVTTVARAVTQLVSTSSSYSTTNVQVSGIDELDIAKTDGRAVYYATGTRVYIVDAHKLKIASVLRFSDYVRGIYVWNHRLVVVTNPRYVTIFRSLVRTVFPFVAPPTSGIAIYVYNVSDIYKPRLLTNITMSGSYLSSRLYRGVLYIVAQQPVFVNNKFSLPVVGHNVAAPRNIEVLTRGDTYLTILALNLSDLHGKAYVYLVNRASMLYMSKSYIVIASNMYSVYKVIPKIVDMYINELPENVAKQVEKLIKEGRFFEAYSEIVKYISRDLAKLKQFVNRIEEMLKREGSWVRVFVFKVNGLDIEKEGYVDVPGHLTKQFAINQLGKYLVLATVRYRISFEIVKSGYTPPRGSITITIRINQQHEGTTTTKTLTLVLPPPAIHPLPYFVLPRVSLLGVGVYVVDLQKLRIVASIPNVVSNEFVYGARLVGTTLFLVTNRVVDPLFAIDLSNPLKPRIVGFVKLPGYLTYLHPVGRNLLLGMGVEKRSLKIELFNVSNLRNIVEVSKAMIENGWSPALYNYHAMTFWPSRGLVLFPVFVNWRNVGVAVVKYSNSSVNVVTILKELGAQRAVWIGDRVYVLSPTEVKVFDAHSWKCVATIHLQ